MHLSNDTRQFDPLLSRFAAATYSLRILCQRTIVSRGGRLTFLSNCEIAIGSLLFPGYGLVGRWPVHRRLRQPEFWPNAIVLDPNFNSNRERQRSRRILDNSHRISRPLSPHDPSFYARFLGADRNDPSIIARNAVTTIIAIVIDSPLCRLIHRLSFFPLTISSTVIFARARALPSNNPPSRWESPKLLHGTKGRKRLLYAIGYN